MLNLLNMSLSDLMNMADTRRRELGYHTVERCAILSAKSGKCSENCAYCAQSSFHTSASPVYPLKSVPEIVAAARRAHAIGAQRFGIVTSGNALNDTELDTLARAISEITATLPLKVCASLGALHVKQLRGLKAAGLSRYHHNIETAPSYYPSIVTTHTFQDRLETVANARAAGLEICCAGILGLGESWEQRLEFAAALNEIRPDSMPLNFLVPIEGTRLYGKVTPLSAEEALRAIALLRVSVHSGSIRLCSGRESVLNTHQAEALAAGASGLLIGGYLTVNTHDLSRDYALIQKVEQTWREDVPVCC